MMYVLRDKNGLFWVNNSFRNDHPKLNLPRFGALEHAFKTSTRFWGVEDLPPEGGTWVSLSEAKGAVKMVVDFTLDEIHEAQKEIEGSSRKAG